MVYRWYVLGLNPEDRGRGLREHAADDSCGELGVGTDVRPLGGYITQNGAYLRSVRLETASGRLVTDVM